MKKNVGKLDRNIRIGLGVIIILAGIAFGSWWGLIGLIPLITGLVNRCGLYLPFGISTCPAETTETT
jgi:hypothetical protein